MSARPPRSRRPPGTRRGRRSSSSIRGGRPGRDDQVAQAHLRLERPAGADPDERRPVGDREDLRDDDLHVVGADAGRDDRHSLAPIAPGDRREFPVLMLELDGIETRGDPGGSVGVTGEEDVLGQFAWTETDVVLPFSGRDRDPAIQRGFDAVVRVRQAQFLAQVAASQARNSAEDSPAFSRASSSVDRAVVTLSRAWAVGGPGGGSTAGLERGHPSRHDSAPRVGATSQGDQQRGQRQGDQRADPGDPGRRRPEPSSSPAPRAPRSDRATFEGATATLLLALGPSVSATGSPAWMIPPGSSTITARPTGTEATRPMTLIASSGSSRGSRSRASPRAMTRPTWSRRRAGVRRTGGRRPAHRPGPLPEERREVDQVGIDGSRIGRRRGGSRRARGGARIPCSAPGPSCHPWTDGRPP